mmetsp:Transcript_5408/g.14600  ORF Transcript_5408/g.14600 Transcript_5408/m.14600 type:complete len:167 (+) Transcript_5408:224-724(+)|eukprot:CAMPEP_0202351638 /NCGR_PEP_ID=MMETSP1126-20121109/8191_1 /ASSEMBLY_ACC=CAM_ASM_000457 /TAXON_ID=3047 /ORGANISM="Dunaliella tertiolecta, Strain CCMP1320" /LENGTH=166 /DNA_ID=CAMNT_0048943771 /DNA_START=130 /DNA_END=630 /DNA_ORIENTATION=+
MAWTDEVHNSRASTSIKKAREERLQKRANEPVTVANSNAGAGAFTLTLSLVVGCMLWRKYDEQLREVQWKELPVIKQFHALITGKPLSGPNHIAQRKPKHRTSPVSTSGKAKAGKSTTSTKSAAQAAAEAAEARLANANVPLSDEPTASTSQQQLASKSKKKKSKK